MQTLSDISQTKSIVDILTAQLFVNTCVQKQSVLMKKTDHGRVQVLRIEQKFFSQNSSTRFLSNSVLKIFQSISYVRMNTKSTNDFLSAKSQSIFTIYTSTAVLVNLLGSMKYSFANFDLMMSSQSFSGSKVVSSLNVICFVESLFHGIFMIFLV